MNDSMNKHTQYMDNLFGDDKNLQIHPSYNGFNKDAYLDWEMTMDKKLHNVVCVIGEKSRLLLVL
jgi:hypothetical protein